MLWFHGIPGAGKSVLFSYIVENVTALCKTDYQDNSVCVYYYCYFGRNQDESTHLLRWVVGQLARHAKFIPGSISSLFELGQQPSNTVLTEAMAELSSYFSRIYLLLDGLDESLQRKNLLHVLKSLADSRFDGIKTLAMSREEPDIKVAMGDLAQAVSLSNPYVDEDIAMYVRNELAGNARLRMYPTGLKEEIEAALAKGAEGM